MRQRVRLAALLVTLPLLAGCPPAGAVVGNYPYDLYDRDVDNMIALLKSGGDGFLNASAITEQFEPFWGKTKSVTIVKKAHVNFQGWYLLEIENTAGERTRFVATYVPNLGRVEIKIKPLGKDD